MADVFGLQGLIHNNYIGLNNELERLFISDYDKTVSSSRWADFSENGHECELDEMDKMMNMRLNLENDTRRMRPQTVTDLPTVRTGSTVMSRAQLLEILRLSERGRGKAKSRHTAANDADRRDLSSSPTGQNLLCVFCRNNGEPASVYASHTLRDAYGKICCPVLYIYTCPICGLSGQDAHTIKYCPLNTSSADKTSDCLKTPRTSCGRRRKLSNEY